MLPERIWHCRLKRSVCSQDTQSTGMVRRCRNLHQHQLFLYSDIAKVNLQVRKLMPWQNSNRAIGDLWLVRSRYTDLDCYGVEEQHVKSSTDVLPWSSQMLVMVELYCGLN
jgi:hypothetical protein